MQRHDTPPDELVLILVDLGEERRELAEAVRRERDPDAAAIRRERDPNTRALRREREEAS